MTEYNIFCYAEDYNDENSFQQDRYRAFNKVVGRKRYYEIMKLINEILKDLKLELEESKWEDEWKKVTDKQDLKLELNTNSWSEEWKKVTNEQWRKILEIPEADKKVIENIIGFELDLENDLIDIDGVKISKSTIKNYFKNLWK
jgi:hypothetical protein